MDFRRGKAEIQAASESASKGGSSYQPFLPSIFWKDDGDSEYIAFLNTLDDIPRLKYHKYIDLGEEGFGTTIARTDPAIGEKVDPIEEQWQYAPSDTNLAVAVKLEVISDIDSQGRQRPRGFEVATNTYERRIRDDKGELTEEREEVTAPIVGVVAQAPINFFNILVAHDANDWPVHLTPIKVSRVGKKDVSYSFVGYPDQELDLSNLVEFIDGVSYLTTDEQISLFEEMEKLDSDEEKATLIGNTLLDKRLEELGDADNYKAILDSITTPSRFPKGKKGKDDKARPARQSQRLNARASEPAAEPEAKPASNTREDKLAALKAKAAKLQAQKQAAAAA